MKIFGRGTSSEDLYMFFLQMATYCEIGISPRHAIEKLLNQFDGEFSIILKNMLRDMTNGTSFAIAVQEQKHCFPPYYSQTILAGEETSDLASSLEQIANHIEQQQEIKRRINLAIRPVVLPSVFILTFLGIVMFSVIPNFEEMYAALDKEMPIYTVVVIKTFRFIADYLYLEISLLAAGAAFAYSYLKKNPSLVDELLLKIPIYKNLHKYYLHCNFINIFSMFTNAGFNSLHALEITAGAVGNEVMARVLRKSIVSMKNGLLLHEALEINNNGIFHPMLINLIGTGEETTKLDIVLKKAENKFNKLTDTQIRSFDRKITPWIVIPAFAILVIVLLSIELPMIMMGTQGG